MGNRCNDYYLLLGNQELESIEGIQDLQERSSGGRFGGAPVEFSVELRWNVRWSSAGMFGGAPVEFSVELRWSSGGHSRKRAKRGPA
jgi:hypothetical protein